MQPLRWRTYSHPLHLYSNLFHNRRAGHHQNEQLSQRRQRSLLPSTHHGSKSAMLFELVIMEEGISLLRWGSNQKVTRIMTSTSTTMARSPCVNRCSTSCQMRRSTTNIVRQPNLLLITSYSSTGHRRLLRRPIKALRLYPVPFNKDNMRLDS